VATNAKARALGKGAGLIRREQLLDRNGAIRSLFGLRGAQKLQRINDRQEGLVEDGASAKHEEHATGGGEGHTKGGSSYHFGQGGRAVGLFGSKCFYARNLKEGFGVNFTDLLVGQGFVGPFGFDDYLQANANDGLVKVNALLSSKRIAEAHDIFGGGQHLAGEAELKRGNPTIGEGELVS